MGINVRNLVNGSLKIIDNTPTTPLFLVIPVEEGNLSFTETSEPPVISHRGTIVGRADPVEVPVSLSFTIMFEEFTGKSTTNIPSVPDALKGRGKASAWVSTDDCGPFVTDLEFTIAKPSNCADANEQQEVLTFSDFHADSIEFGEAEDGDTLTITGTALVTTPTAVRS